MRRRRIGASEWPRSPSRRQIFRWALWGAGILVCSTVQRRLGGGLYDANDILDYIQEEGRSLSSNHVDDDVIFDVQHWARPILPNDFAVNDRTGVNSAISNDAEEWTDSEEDNLDGSTDENYYDNDGYDYIEYDADDGGGDGIDDKDEISLEEELPPTIIPPEGIDWPFQTTNEARIYFIHVGKAGGQSLYKRILVRGGQSISALSDGGERRSIGYVLRSSARSRLRPTQSPLWPRPYFQPNLYRARKGVATASYQSVTLYGSEPYRSYCLGVQLSPSRTFPRREAQATKGIPTREENFGQDLYPMLSQRGRTSSRGEWNEQFHPASQVPRVRPRSPSRHGPTCVAFLL
jgi:hypothetical protein